MLILMGATLIEGRLYHWFSCIRVWKYLKFMNMDGNSIIMVDQ